MLVVISFFLVIFSFTALYVVCRRLRWAPVGYTNVSLFLALALGFFSFFGTLLPLFSTPWIKGGLALLCSGFCAGFLQRKFWASGEPIENQGRKLFWLCLLSLIAMSDGFFIFAKQGWHLEGAGPYFRPPFNHDFIRNVGLISNLVQERFNPFLPHSSLSYQSFWHEGAVLFVETIQRVFNPLSRYETTAGVGIAYGVMFYFVLFAQLAAFRPKLFFKFTTPLALLVLFATHAEIFNMLSSFIKRGSFGLEADWSVSQPIFFRFVSLKLSALSNPQHVYALLFVFLFLTIRKNTVRVSSPGLLILQHIFLGFSVLASPIFATLGFLFWILTSFQELRAKQFLTLLGSAALSALLYFLCTHVSPVQLFAVQRSEPLLFFGNIMSLWKWFPLELPAAFGVSGVLLIFLGIRKLWVRDVDKRDLLAILVLVAFLGFANHGWTNPELRRHMSLFLSVIVPYLVVQSLADSKGMQVCLGVAATVSLLLHSYFLYSYLGKPSLLPNDLAWRDYFEMNQTIREKYSKSGVIAATQSAMGLEMPVALEAGVTWAGIPSAIVHGELSREQKRLLSESEFLGSILPRARALGYKYIEWGPFEEKVWPGSVKDRFVDSSEKVAEHGKVSLYRLRDRVLDFKSDGFEKAEKLRLGGWIQEASVEYRLLLLAQPQNAKAAFGLAVCSKILEDFPTALENLNLTLKLSPTNLDARFTRGVVYTRVGRWYDALNDFSLVRIASPDYAGLDRNIQIVQGQLSNNKP